MLLDERGCNEVNPGRKPQSRVMTASTIFVVQGQILWDKSQLGQMGGNE